MIIVNTDEDNKTMKLTPSCEVGASGSSRFPPPSLRLLLLQFLRVLWILRRRLSHRCFQRRFLQRLHHPVVDLFDEQVGQLSRDGVLLSLVLSRFPDPLVLGNVRLRRHRRRRGVVKRGVASLTAEDVPRIVAENVVVVAEPFPQAVRISFLLTYVFLNYSILLVVFLLLLLFLSAWPTKRLGKAPMLPILRIPESPGSLMTGIGPKDASPPVLPVQRSPTAEANALRLPTGNVDRRNILEVLLCLVVLRSLYDRVVPQLRRRRCHLP